MIVAHGEPRFALHLNFGQTLERQQLQAVSHEVDLHRSLGHRLWFTIDRNAADRKLEMHVRRAHRSVGDILRKPLTALAGEKIGPEPLDIVGRGAPSAQCNVQPHALANHIDPPLQHDTDVLLGANHPVDAQGAVKRGRPALEMDFLEGLRRRLQIVGMQPDVMGADGHAERRAELAIESHGDIAADDRSALPDRQIHIRKAEQRALGNPFDVDRFGRNGEQIVVESKLGSRDIDGDPA